MRYVPVLAVVLLGVLLAGGAAAAAGGMLVAQAPAAAAPAPEVRWFTPTGTIMSMGNLYDGGDYDIEAVSVGLVTGEQTPEGLVIQAVAGAPYEIQIKVRYQAKAPTKVAANIVPDVREFFQSHPPDAMDLYNRTVHFSSEDRAGYQNVSGEGELTITLQGWAPTTAGRHAKTLEVGLFTPADSPLGRWATIVIRQYPFTVVVPAAYQAAGGGRRPRDLVLYEGDLRGAPHQLYVSSWGGGYAKEVPTFVYYGPNSLQVSTQGYYQGAVFRWFDPVDISTFVSRPNSFLELRIRPYYGKEANPTPATTPGAPAPGSPAAPAAPVTASVLGGIFGRRGSEEEAPAAAGPAPAAVIAAPTAAAQPRKLTPVFLMDRMRVVVETEQGFAEVSGWPLEYASEDRAGWSRLGIPLFMFKGSALGAQLKSLRIFGEPKDAFYLGQLKLAVVEQAMAVKATADPAQVAAGTPVKFEAKLVGYSGPVKVSWDFDRNDGVAEEAVGMKASRIYRTAGTYTVTCTATDMMGKQSPVSTTLAVRVQ